MAVIVHSLSIGQVDRVLGFESENLVNMVGILAFDNRFPVIDAFRRKYEFLHPLISAFVWVKSFF
jgi:hypothetical protein